MAVPNLPDAVADGQLILTDWGNDVRQSFLDLDGSKADKSTTISAGTGLTGGGDLSASRSLAVAYGTTAGTAAQGNDSRITGATPSSRTITAGTGLTGGGDLSANRTLSVNFGSTSTTVASGDRVATLEGNTPKSGKITQIAATGQGATVGGNTTVNFGTNTDTGVGVSYSGGSFTFTKFGRWYLASTIAFSALPASGGVFALRFVQASDGSNYGQNTSSVVNTSFGAGTSISWSPTITAGNAVWSVQLVLSSTPTGTYTIAGDSRTAFTAVYLGPVT